MRLLLLAEHANTGVISVRRAQCWPAGAAAGTVAAAVGAAYRTATGQAPTSVHVVHTEPGSLWTTAIRRAVGPLAELTTHTPTTSNADWPTAVRHALAGLNADLAEDPDQVTTLAEHATTRTTYA
ncbi:hypothetical protein [Streptomyces sp. NPDC003480]